MRDGRITSITIATNTLDRMCFDRYIYLVRNGRIFIAIGFFESAPKVIYKMAEILVNETWRIQFACDKIYM